MPIATSEWILFKKALHAYIARRVATDAVDDIAAEVMLRMADQTSGFSAAAQPMAWMYRVAANLIADHYRRRGVEQRHFAPGEQTECRDRVSEEQDSTPEKELALCLLPLIKQLPEHYREAIQRVDIEGESQVNAAKRLGLSTSAMKSRVQRGRQKLKQLLVACCRIEINQRGLMTYEQKHDCC